MTRPSILICTLVLVLFGSGCQNLSQANGTESQQVSQHLDPSPNPMAHSAERDFTVVTVAEGLSHPRGLAFLPNGSALITERPGRLRLLTNGKLSPEPLQGVPEVFARHQAGLMDVALHPDFSANTWVYLSYAKAGAEGATTVVSRGRLTESGLEEVEEIFVAKAWGSGGQHLGSRLLFDDQHYLYITVGDRGDMERAQNPMDHAGTTIRLHDDGSIPKDNPFVDRDGYLPEIFSYGHRNAQGMALHPETRQVWQNEHGPRGGDELNIIRAGANYGWPKVTHGINYNGRQITPHTELPGLESPVLHWTPSIACSGLEFYTGEAFPQWKGNAFVGALVQTHLRRVVFRDGEPEAQEELLKDLGERIRAVKQGPDDLLYLLTDSGNGKLLRLEPK